MDDADPTKASNIAAAASADHTATADTSVGEPGPETMIVPDVRQQQAAELAWSSDSDTADYVASTENYTWRATWVRVAMVAVCALVVAGGVVGVWAWRHSTQTHPAPVPAVGLVLDGIYEIASDNEHRTVNAVPQPSVDITRYWAFRSLCTQTGCVATAAEVDDISHQTPYADHDHTTWRWHYGSWREELDHNTLSCASAPGSPQATATMVRTLAPQPDGTLKGGETDAVDNNAPCGAGKVISFSITAKRIGDTPPGVVADPADAGPPPPPTLYVTEALASTDTLTYRFRWARVTDLAAAEAGVLAQCQHAGHVGCVVAGYTTECMATTFGTHNRLWVGYGPTRAEAVQDVAAKARVPARPEKFADCAQDVLGN